MLNKSFLSCKSNSLWARILWHEGLQFCFGFRLGDTFRGAGLGRYLRPLSLCPHISYLPSGNSSYSGRRGRLFLICGFSVKARRVTVDVVVVLITRDWMPEYRHYSSLIRCPHCPWWPCHSRFGTHLFVYDQLMFASDRAYSNDFYCLVVCSSFTFLNLVSNLFCTWLMYSSFTIFMSPYCPCPSFLTVTTL